MQWHQGKENEKIVVLVCSFALPTEMLKSLNTSMDREPKMTLFSNWPAASLLCRRIFKMFWISVCTLKGNCYHYIKQRYYNFLLFLVMIVSMSTLTCFPLQYMETHHAHVTWWHIVDTSGQSWETQTMSKLLGGDCCQNYLTWLVKFLNSGTSFHEFDQIMLRSSIYCVPLHCSLLSKCNLQGFLDELVLQKKINQPNKSEWYNWEWKLSKAEITSIFIKY